MGNKCCTKNGLNTYLGETIKYKAVSKELSILFFIHNIENKNNYLIAHECEDIMLSFKNLSVVTML
jgi:hypothetical protein